MLTDEHRVAFASLRVIWPDQRIVLIGAGALRAHNKLSRFTADLDIAIAIDQSDYPGRLAEDTAWQRHKKQHQRRDLEDLAFLLTEYLDEANDTDFERMLVAIQQGYVEQHTAQAFLLGQDVAGCEGAHEIAPRFITSLSTTYQWMLTSMRAKGPAALSRDEAFEIIWKSFLDGLGV